MRTHALHDWKRVPCYNNCRMDEVAGILIALGGLIVGLLVLGWAYGDFNP